MKITHEIDWDHPRKCIVESGKPWPNKWKHCPGWSGMMFEGALCRIFRKGLSEDEDHSLRLPECLAAEREAKK